MGTHANLRLRPWIITLGFLSAIAGGIAALAPAEKLLG